MTRRFIAGASCPSCAATDTLFLLAGELNGAFECAACGHKEYPPDSGRGKSALNSEEIEPVKFVDVGSNED